MQSFPEVDRGAWYSLQQAQVKLSPGQRPLLQAVAEL
jgi:predicted NUDIX family NTP pyrophosphohydrolase